jgi:hypothetical protein
MNARIEWFALALVITAMLAGRARADRPTIDEVKATVFVLRDALSWPLDAATPPNVGAAAPLVAAPFRYAGFDLAGAYSSVQLAHLEPCRKRWGFAGTVASTDVPKFMPCAALLHWQDRLDTAEWSAITSRKLPKQLAGYAKTIAAIDGAVLVLAYTPRPGPETEYWNLFAAIKTKDGDVRLVGWFAARKNHGDD